MILSNTNEQAFELLIENALVGSTVEGRRESGSIEVDNQSPSADKYYWGLPSDMDKTLALDTRRLWSFLKTTQQDEIDSYRGRDLETSVPKQLSKTIETIGVIDVLRNGFDVDNVHFTMFYPKPTAADSEESHRRYALNQFSITRQQTFSVTNPSLEIDMVVYVNGIPIFTIELKNPWTHQTARIDGQAQYKSSRRDPREKLLQFGRCLAHFTLDKDEIFFTTRLELDKTYFMPFNKGLANGAGAGNPIPLDGGFKTSYFWNDVLKKDTLSDIIMNYVLFDYGETRTKKKVPHIMKNAEFLIFPRYHQLDVVNQLVDNVKTLGVGKTYLIQHSAGSGKSNSITWLAYKLIKECPSSLDAVRAKGTDLPLYDSVIVVTDRRLLDKQITDNIKAFGHSEKIVSHAGSAADLKAAIEGGKRIIITTIQKFPFICDTIRDVSDHNFAIIIDEAHSSQSGIAADKMNAAVQKAIVEDGEVTTDSILMELMLSRRMSTNCSYFAFTATPKRETLERFGIKREDGSFAPFHLYSMKQAIEEGFILDVLTNYTTYKSYYELVKSIESNPIFETERAQKLLKKAVEREPKTIRAKAEQIINHFDANIFRAHKLMGKAKAMVVTKDIYCAIKYYNALMEIKRENNLPFGILIAFSGTKNDNGTEYSEASINGFPEKDTAEEFDKDDNRILVVANKFLTGFDQPKLCAMYIDKPLAGVLAVQSLSRLNRAKPSLGKRSEDLFILDFYNKLDDIKASFDPYYTTTSLSEATDVNILHELRSTLLSVGVFEQEDVDAFSELYVTGKPAEEWTIYIDTASDRFNNEISWPKDGQADFKIKCKQFVKIYSRVAAIMTYEVKEWEKLFWYLRFLIPALHVTVAGRDDLKDLLDSVDLNTYGLRRTALHQTISLDDTPSVIDPNKAAMAGAGGDEPEYDELDEIVRIFNECHFTGWEATPEDQKTKLISIVSTVAQEDDYRNLVIGNPDPQAVEDTLNRIIDEVVRKKRQGDTSLYKQYQQNEEFKSQFRHVITRMLNSLNSTPQETLIRGIGFSRDENGSILQGAVTANNRSVIEGMECVRTVRKNPEWKNVALAVRQPWASLICAGIKDIENRSWQTDYRGRLYIVASSKNEVAYFDDGAVPDEWIEQIQEAQDRGILDDLHTLPQNAVIGYVDIEDCTGEEVDSIWSNGSLINGNVNWVLKNAHTFNQPKLPGYKAKLNLFEIKELEDEV